MEKCEFCGKELKKDQQYFYDDVILCESCWEEQTEVCEYCHGRIWVENAERHQDLILCSDCYHAHYTHCEECGILIHNDDAYYFDFGDQPYCGRCFSEQSADSVIKEYGYKPEPIFYGSGDLFLGVELEIDKGGEKGEHAQTILDIANEKEEHLYCKHDGSIEDGFELVSHPMTLAYHEERMPWREILSTAAAMDYCSHQTATCGLHCHVNRSALGDTEEEQEEVIARIVYFVETHWNKLLRFSRRTEENINRWASRYGVAGNPKETYKNAKDKRLGRYVAVNLENTNTIEFRLFRGTLRYETFLAALQLVEAICSVCKERNDAEIEKLSWNEFAEGIRKKELADYLKARQLCREEK